MTITRNPKGTSHILQLSLALLTLLLLAPATASSAQADSPPDQPTLSTPGDSEEMDNSESLEFSWDESTQSATWFYIWVNRNGAKYRDQWVGGDNHWKPSDNFPGGQYHWWVRPWGPGGYGPWSSAGQFSIFTNVPGQITLTGPTGSTETNSTLNYTWQADKSASWYELYVSCNNAYFTDKWYHRNNLTDLGNGDLSAPVQQHRKGAYRWWVRGWSIDGMGAWSSAGSFNMPSQAPGSVTCIAPAEGETVGQSRPELRWSETQPSADWYQIYLSCNKTQYLSMWVQTESWTPPNNLPAGDYTWWVQPWNPDGLGSWSSAAHFTVQSGVPAAIQAVSPQGEIHGGTTLNYMWHLDPNATWYQLCVSCNSETVMNRWVAASDLTNLELDHFGTECEGHDSGNYQWWVRGWGPEGLGPWSPAMSFSIITNNSEFSEADLPALFANYTPAHHAVNGSLLHKWLAYNATEPVPALDLGNAGAFERPDVISSGLNGFETVRFNGLNQVLTLNTVSLPQPWTAFLVYKPISYVGNACILTFDADKQATVQAGGEDGVVKTYAGGMLTSPASFTSGSWHIMTACFAGANSFVQHELDTPVTGDAGTTAGTLIRFANYNGSLFANIEVAQLVITTNAATAEMVTKEVNALKTRFGL